MKTTPKGIENLTDDERRVTRIDEARPIPGYSRYYITPAGWVWDCKKQRFLKPAGARQGRKFGYRLAYNKKRHYYTVRDLVGGVFGITW